MFLLLIINNKNHLRRSLHKSKSVSVHHKNLWSLAIEMYEVHWGIPPKILNSLFGLRQADQYNLRIKILI